MLPWSSLFPKEAVAGLPDCADWRKRPITLVHHLINLTTSTEQLIMAFPTFTPPIYHSVLFHKEQCPKANQPRKRYALALKNPPLYGISVGDYDCGHIDLGWPGISEYQAVYCTIGRPKLPDPSGACQRCPVPLPSREQSGSHGTKRPCSMPRERSLYKLHEKVPLPLVDKRIRGCHYRVNQPLGFMTKEERTKTKIGFLGPQRMTWSTEYDDAFLPNYRYKEWVERPKVDLVRELENNIFTCRAPKIDTQHYDFYHQVRMRRPTPVIPEEKFMSCAVIPMPKDIVT